MKRTTITYGGRTYCHQQVYGLLRALLAAGFSCHLRKSTGFGFVMQLEQLRDGLVFRAAGSGSTIWLAMAEAVARTGDG